MPDRNDTLHRECAAEFAGTFILVFFGTGAIHVAVLTGALEGLWQVAIVWGLAVTLAIYATAARSGAHLNPAVTLALSVYRGFSWRKAGPYVLAQVAGAFSAAATLHALFYGLLLNFESAHHIVRGQPGSEASAMVYGEYFPNPAVAGATSSPLVSVTEPQAMLAEAIGTAFLVLFVLALTDSRNTERFGGKAAAFWIGLGVSIIICIIAPLTQAGLNPARDFGPRVFAWLAGWKDVAIPGPRGGFFTVYILSPLLGAVAGAGVYQFALCPRRRESAGPAD